jgi:cell shape-determining protein MreC
MFDYSPNKNLWLSTGIMLLLTMLVWLGEKNGLLTSTQLALHNAINPGRLAVLAISPRETVATGKAPDLSENEIAELQNALLQNELQRRQLLIDNARLHNELRAMKKLGSIQSVTGRDLVNFIALKANVLSQSGLPGRLREAIIDAGRSHGLQRSQLVVEGNGIVIDKGADHGLQPGQKVAHGTAVIGRIAKTSQWVGLVQPITHLEFSSAVQIVKLEPQGASFGAKGLLEGTGDGLCRITGIAYTEAVAVGDEVFSADLDGVNGPRLYYGRIIHAQFSAGGRWDIKVKPAFDANEITEVGVVQQRLDAKRTRIAVPQTPVENRR